MKRTVKVSITFLFSLSLTLALLFSIAIPASSAQTHVAKEYHYESALAEYGNITGLKMDAATGSYDSRNGFLFCGGLWTYEYYNPNLDIFEPMTSYYKDTQKGWIHSSWSNLYTAFAEAAWTNSGYSYCSILSGGKYLHPGKTASPALTFVAPVSGTVSYNASLYAYGASNNPSSQGSSWGSYVTLWVNDRQVYPAASSSPEVSRIGSHNTSESSPLSVSYASFRISAGDKIRLCVSAADGNNSAKGTCLIDLPTVTYHQADVPVVDSSSGHTWSSWTVVTTATCTESGSQYRTCSECKEKESQTVSPLNHSFGSWTVLSQPTCKAEGQQKRTCTVCREDEYQSIPAKEHTYGSWTRVSGSCTQDGTEIRNCSACQTTESRTVAPAGHTWSDWKVTKAPTATAEGTETATCTTCGETETRTVAPLTEDQNSGTSDSAASDLPTPDGDGNSSATDPSDTPNTVTDPAGDPASVATDNRAEGSGKDDPSSEEKSFPWWTVIAAECVIIVACGGGLMYVLIWRKKKLASPKPEETQENNAE